MSLFGRGFRWVIRRLSGYFLRGLLLIVPIGITAYVVYMSFVFLDSLLPFQWPGLSIVIIVAGTILLGSLGTILIRTPLLQLVNDILERIPLVKFIYTSIRDLLSAFVGNKKRFNKPVLVRMNRDVEVYKLGFITQSDLSEIGIPGGKSAVYLPHSYNFSGNLFIVDNELISSIDAPADEVMKFIVSGGITRISHADPVKK